MVARLNCRIDLRATILAFPVVFLIHDLEEVLMVERFWRENRAYLPLPPALKRLSRRVEATAGQFAVAVAYLLALFSAVSYLAARNPSRTGSARLFTTFLSVAFLNVFTHLGQALALRKYTPGLVTAVFLILPYSLYTFRRLYQAGLLTKRVLRQSMLAGALLGIPLALSGLLIGKALSH